MALSAYIIWQVIEGFFALIGFAIVALGVACALMGTENCGLGPKELM